MQYSKKVLDHFTRPHNQGEMKDADAQATVGNPKCGDIMKMYLKIGKNDKGDEIIEDVKFQTLGCGAAIATSSMATDLVKGKTIEEAMQITNQKVADELDGLPPTKLHCSNLAADAIHKAIENYKETKFFKK